jgi:multidrug efflux system outer membrane protein
MRKHVVLSLLLSATLSACAVGPDYRAPDVATTLSAPAKFEHADEPGVAPQSIRERFWTAFDDPLLAELVADGLTGNRELRQAEARLRESRAILRLRGYDLAPTVTADARYEQGLRSTAQSPGLSREQREGDLADAGFDAIWELDLFGRVRRDVEAAQADADAQAAEFADVQVTVAAEIARRYVELRGTQDQLAVARSNADNQRQTLAITQALLDAGRGNQLDASRAEASWRNTLSRIPELQATEAANLHALAVLTGREPGALYDRLAPPRPAPAVPTLAGIETPEALLRRRPDIRVAERRLAAATARIGVAVGDLFPKLTLSGSIGYNAADLSDFGGGASERYGFGPSLSWAAFDLGRVRTRIEIAELRAEGALAAYESAVLGALQETETVLVAYGRAQQQRDELARAEAASAAAAALARQRFEAGMTPFVDVLDAERELLSLQDALSQSRTRTLTALLALYKALGGGWVAT